VSEVVEDGSKKLYRHTMETEQRMARLLAKIDANQESLVAKIGYEIKTIQEKQTPVKKKWKPR
jgi:hypothetical protein